jgi:hypothetical protein
MNVVNNAAQDHPERQEIDELLPWHAAGTLSRRDAQRVEEALANDQELVRRFELVREELDDTIRLNESLGAPSSRAMEKLFAAIDAEGAPARSYSSISIGTRISEFFASLTPRTLAWSAAAAAVAIVMQAGILTGLLVNERAGPGTFSTASYQKRVAAVVPAPEAVIRFAPQATAADVTRFLQTYNATVIDGPRAGGLYRIRIASGDGQAPADVGEVVKKMQADRAVVGFAAVAR